MLITVNKVFITIQRTEHSKELTLTEVNIMEFAFPL